MTHPHRLALRMILGLGLGGCGADVVGVDPPDLPDPTSDAGPLRDAGPAAIPDAGASDPDARATPRDATLPTPTPDLGETDRGRPTDASAPAADLAAPGADAADAADPEPDAALDPAPDTGPDAAPEPPPSPSDRLLGPGLPPAACGALAAYEARFEPDGVDGALLELRLGSQHSAEGRCGGNGPDLVLAFTAPEAGLWTFAPESPLWTTWPVLHARTVCDDPESEVACARRAWPGEPVDDGILRLTLDAGERVFIVVDSEVGSTCYPQFISLTDAPDDACRIRVRARHAAGATAPTLSAVQAYTYGNGRVVVEATVDDPNGDALFAWLWASEANGRPAAGRDGFSTYPVGVEVPAPQGLGHGVARVYLDALEAASVSVRIQDGHHESSEIVTAPVEQRVPLAWGAPCDPSLVDAWPCADFAECTPGLRVPTCGESGRVDLVSARVFESQGTLLAEVAAGGREHERPFLVELMAADDDRPLVVGPGGDTHLVGRKVDWEWGEGAVPYQPELALLALSTPDGVPVDAIWALPARRARVRLGTPAAPLSEPLIVPLEPARARRLNERCIEGGFGGDCAVGLTCGPAGQGTLYGCRSPEPPTLEVAEAHRTPDGRLSLFAVARGVNAVATVLFQPLDANGEFIPLWQFDGLLVFRMPYLWRPDGRPVGEHIVWNVRVPIELDRGPATSLVRMVAYDAAGQASAPILAPITEMVPQPDGAACDPVGARALCDAGLLCVATEPPPEAPEALQGRCAHAAPGR